MVSLPLVCATLGVWLYTLLMSASCMMSWLTCSLMVHGSRNAPEKTFIALGGAAFGETGARAATSVLLAQTLSTLVAFLVLTKSMSPTLLAGVGESNGGSDADMSAKAAALMAFCVLFLVLPLSMLKDIRALGPACFAAVGMFIFLVATLVAMAMRRIAMEGAGALTGLRFECVAVADVLRRCPTLLFAFACHPTALPIYAGLRDGTPQRMDRISATSFAACLAMYLLCGIGGCVAFRGALEGKDSVLEAFAPGVLTWCLQVAMVLAVLLGYPCVAFSTRKELMYVLYGKHGKWTFARHTGVTIGIVGFTFGIALAVPDLTTAFAWIGATVSVVMSFLFPAAAFMWMWPQLPKSRTMAMRVVCARIVAFVGVLIVCVCVANNLTSSASPTAETA